MDALHKRIQKMVDNEKYNGYRIKELRTIFNKYQNKTNWKAPFDAYISKKSDVDKLLMAIVYFHAVNGTYKKETAPYKHKEGLVTMAMPIYLVHSSGYNAY